MVAPVSSTITILRSSGRSPATPNAGPEIDHRDDASAEVDHALDAGGLAGIGRGGVWRMISCTSVIGTPNSSSPSVNTTGWRVWSSVATSVLMAT